MSNRDVQRVIGSRRDEPPRLEKSPHPYRGAVETRSLRARMRKVLRHPQFWFGLAVLTPILAWYLILAAWPIFRAFQISFFQWNVLNPSASTYVGLENYVRLTTDEVFQIALDNSVIYVILLAAGVLPISLFLAVLLERAARGRQFYLFFIFAPVIMSVVAVSLIFTWFYDPTAGLFNYILHSLHVPQQSFLLSEQESLYSVIAMNIWQAVGFYTVIFLAGLLEIPTLYYDAAKVDGASSWSTFRHVTLPLLSNTMLFAIVILSIGAFQVFTPIQVMTGGGPGHSSYVLSLLVYVEGLTNYNFGFASAVAFVIFAAVLVITVIQLRLLRKSWEY